LSTTPGQTLNYSPENRDENTLFGHPKGLFVLFSTEAFERFSFYTMRGILTLYLVNNVLNVMTQSEGKEASGGFADEIYGAYLGFVYAATFIGGMLADRLLGQRRAIYIGGVLMALAHFTLTTHAILTQDNPGKMNFIFFAGLGLLACGNGFFKPNISTIVGSLYTPEDKRRDSAFTIFYMGINIGATAASFMSGAAQKWAWYLGYLLAGIGMVASLLCMLWGRKHIAGKGMPPVGASLAKGGPMGLPSGLLLLVGMVAFVPIAGYMMSKPTIAQYLSYVSAAVVFPYLIWETTRGTREEAGRMIVIIVLCLFSMVFWGFFELQGSTITRFVEDKVNTRVLGFEMPAAFVANFVNSFLVIILSIPFSALWIWLDKRGLEPSSPLKFSLALAQVALGFIMFWIGATSLGADGRCSLIWPLLAYLFLTTGELCLSPVGLSMITKLSPVRLVGVFMGVWFLVSAIANVITGGAIGKLTKSHGYSWVFMLIAAICAGASVVLFILTPALKKRMHGLK